MFVHLVHKVKKGLYHLRLLKKLNFSYLWDFQGKFVKIHEKFSELLSSKTESIY